MHRDTVGLDCAPLHSSYWRKPAYLKISCALNVPVLIAVCSCYRVSDIGGVVFIAAHGRKLYWRCRMHLDVELCHCLHSVGQ
jgi:hypothetical protein